MTRSTLPFWGLRGDRDGRAVAPHAAPAKRGSCASASDAGVAAIEFALVLPLLLVLVFGIIDYGYFFLLDMQCTQAAREGARKGVVQTTIAQAQTTAQAAALSYLASVGLNAGANVPTVALPTTANDGVGGTNLVVTVILSPFRALVGFVPTPPGITITSTMHYEGAVGP